MNMSVKAKNARPKSVWYEENGRLNIPQITNNDAMATANKENNERARGFPALSTDARSRSSCFSCVPLQVEAIGPTLAPHSSHKAREQTAQKLTLSRSG